MGQVKTIKRGELARHGYVPPEGTTGQVLKKTSDDDSDTEFGDPIKSGGTEGQTFRKNSTSDFDGKWEDQFPIVTEESSKSVTPINFTYREKLARRYLTANDAAAAATNTAALQALFNPFESGFRGKFIFDGNEDTYYFSDKIPFRQGVEIQCEGNTLQVTRTGDSTDTDEGFIHAIEDFIIENGTINIDYTHTAGTNTFNALMFGGRSGSSINFPNFFENLDPYQNIGNIVVRNMEITHNGGTTCSAILMFGGLRNCLFENVNIDGNGDLKGGVSYEFGWATSQSSAALRQTAHANNIVLRNMEINNIDDTAGVIGWGVRLAGAYNSWLENVNIRGAFSGILVAPGEALNFQPANPENLAGIKRNIAMKNIVMSEIESIGIDVTGFQSNSGFLSSVSIPDIDLVDLYDFSIDGFSIVGGTGSTTLATGMRSSAGKTDIRNGYITGAINGITLHSECTQFEVDNVICIDNSSTGMRFDFNAGAIFSPVRKKVGKIRSCKIAGNTGVGLRINDAESVTVENSRFGYETNHDGKTETAQTAAINVGANAHVIARDNFVAGVSGGGSAYIGDAGGEGILINPRGVTTSDAEWGNYVTNADTSGATLVDLETEVNELKATLRAVGIIET